MAELLSRGMLSALNTIEALVDIHAVSSDGKNTLRLVTNVATDIAPTFTEYTRTAETWSGARLTVSAYVNGREQVFFDARLTRQRLTPMGSMQPVWVAGPSMPKGEVGRG